MVRSPAWDPRGARFDSWCVFFSCVRRAGRGGGIQGVSVVVVANFDKIIEIREMVK